MLVTLSNNKHECSTQMQPGFESTKAFLMPDADIDRSAPCKREENGSRWSHPRNGQFVQYCKWGNLSHSGTYFVNEIELFLFPTCHEERGRVNAEGFNEVKYERKVAR